MKQFGCIVICSFALMACRKSVNQPADNFDPASVVGKWRLVVDSNYAGFGVANHLVTYKGGTGDYFVFNPGGALSMHEHGTFQLVSYSQTSDSTIVIFSFNGGNTDQNCRLHLSPHDATIGTGFSYTPGGTFGRKVYLLRVD